MHFSSPLASIGFKRFAASIEPSVLPAPTRLCISSMKRMILPSASLISSRTAFSLSSNSPRYLAPAMSAPMSSSMIFLSLRLSGTSFFMILHASPSTTAVLPTPGSPMRTGLFLVFLLNISMTLLISSSRPITGSIFPSMTSCTRSWPYFSSASRLFSLVASVIFLPPLLSSSWLVTSLRLSLYFFTISFETDDLLNSSSMKIVATVRYFSSCSFAHTMAFENDSVTFLLNTGCGT